MSGLWLTCPTCHTAALCVVLTSRRPMVVALQRQTCGCAPYTSLADVWHTALARLAPESGGPRVA